MNREQKKKGRGLLDFLRQRGKGWLLVGGVVLGALLLVLGSGFGESSAVGEGENDLALQATQTLEDYRTELEKRLEKLCNAVDGVGGAHVLVTLECGYRTVYTTNGDGDPAVVGTGSNQQPLYKTLQPPVVAGVAVVCNGGDRAHVQYVLTELIATALGIPSNRVCVTRK